MQEIPAALFGRMFGEPLAHLVVGPVPREGMRVPAIVLRPGVLHMLEKLLLATPGSTLQIAPAESPNEQFRLIQPRGMDGRKAGSPPVPMRCEVLLRRCGRVTGIAVLNQEAARQMAMARRRKSSRAAL